VVGVPAGIDASWCGFYALKQDSFHQCKGGKSSFAARQNVFLDLFEDGLIFRISRNRNAPH